MVDAIEQCVDKFADKTSSEVALVSLLGTHQGRLQDDLAALGFQSESLSDAELISFSKIRHQLVADTGSMTGVRRLADVYFPGASVQRGRPYPRQKLESVRGIRLADRGERRHVVSVMLAEAPAPERISEFMSNCRRLVPVGTRVEVRVALADFKASDEFRLGQGITGGRLGCRISPN